MDLRWAEEDQSRCAIGWLATIRNKSAKEAVRDASGRERTSVPVWLGALPVFDCGCARPARAANIISCLPAKCPPLPSFLCAPAATATPVALAPHPLLSL